jgi:hypothetical protein
LNTPRPSTTPDPDLAADSKQSFRAFRGIALLYFGVFVTHGIWRITFPNYSVEVVGVTQSQMSTLISASAIPGVLAGLIGLASRHTSIGIVLAFSCLTVGFGLIGTGMATHWAHLLAGGLAISIGFVAFYPAVNAVCIAQSRADCTGRQLGRLKSLGPLAGLAAAFCVLVLSADHFFDAGWPETEGTEWWRSVARLAQAFSERPGLDPERMRMWLLTIGACMLAVGLLGSLRFVRISAAGIRGGLKLRSALLTYYGLNFLAGCRSGLFQSFVLYTMIHDHGLRIHGTAVLVLGGHIIGFLGYRMIGLLTNAYSPATVLGWLYAIVAMLFAAFAFISTDTGLDPDLTMVLLMALFLVDSAVFGASVATDAYLKRRSEPNRLLGDIAAGMSAFYVGVAFMPALTTMIVTQVGATQGESWMHRAPFLIGTGLALIAVGLSQRLRASNP